ncbi:hypothetical protein ACJX0J_023939, partial [Zea mays]
MGMQLFWKNSQHHNKLRIALNTALQTKLVHYMHSTKLFRWKGMKQDNDKKKDLKSA